MEVEAQNKINELQRKLTALEKEMKTLKESLDMNKKFLKSRVEMLNSIRKNDVLNVMAKNKQAEEKMINELNEEIEKDEKNIQVLSIQIRNVNTDLEKLGIGKKNSPCFIATAVYGENTWEVHLFRKWKDEVLQNHLSGRLFIKFYYLISPILARFIWNKNSLKHLVRTFLNKILCLLLVYKKNF